METFITFIKESYTLILAFLGSGAVGGWFLKKLDYKRDREKSKSHLKAKMLDEILEQCRNLEKSLNSYPGYLCRFKDYIEDDSIDQVTGYPNKMFDFDSESGYHAFIFQLNDEKEKLRHLHQDYVIKTKSDDLPTIKSIEESITKIINFEIHKSFNFENAYEEHLMVITDLRTIYHEVKEHYPEEVPVEK